MTVSIRQALGMLPSGEQGQPLSESEFGGFLRAKLGLNGEHEKHRNARHALRDRLFRDGGDGDMEALIDKVFEDADVRRKRKAFVPIAKFSNSLKRIVGELSTVYAEPARRSVGGDATNEAKYADLLDDLSFDEQMAVVNAMLNLHRVVLVGPRVRVNADGTREMVLDIATPSTVRAICNPLDMTQVLGWLVRVEMPIARTPDAWGPSRPTWALWTDHEWAYLNENLDPIAGTWKEHGLGVNRWVPVSYSAAAVPCFWPGHEGEDLVAAQMTIWLSAVLMIKETRSNTKLPIVSGDTSQMAKDQAADSDTPIAMPEGVSVTTIDVGTDPSVFITAGDHALKRAGNNYGLSMEALTHQGTQSAEARELMLAPIRERRRQQIKILRRAERRLARVMAAICKSDLPEYAFTVETFRIDFGDSVALLSKADRLAIFEKERALGLTNTVEYLMSEDPDIDEADAWDDIAENIQVETTRRVMMNDLIAMSGSMGGNAPAAIAPTPPPVAVSSATQPPQRDGEPAMSMSEAA